jgi:hypothetical protein
LVIQSEIHFPNAGTSVFVCAHTVFYSQDSVLYRLFCISFFCSVVQYFLDRTVYQVIEYTFFNSCAVILCVL